MSVRVADVYKNRVRAAELRRTDDATLFEYTADYLAAGLPAVASTLPLGSAVGTPPGAVPAFFAGLLPEGRRLSALRRAIKASADDELSLLCAVGADTVGDVQIVETGAALGPVAPLIEIDDPRTLRFADLIERVDPVGLPGIQEKVSGRMISLPARTGTSDIILKLDPPEFPHVVENEAYFIDLARRCRLPVVRARVIRDVDDRPGLLVDRFDRADSPGGDTELFAVEDACQTMGLWPADKYSMTAAEAVHSLAALCVAERVAVRDLFRQIVFAVLTGNGDQHAKNLSIVADAHGEYRVSPAYDLPSTVFYGDSSLALPVHGKRTGLSRRIVLGFADDIGLPRRLAERIIEELLQGTGPMIEEIESGVLPFDARTNTTAAKELRYRRRLLSG
ncbi:type II toxin-antitoxin system HipA family toxin [Microbacterium sp. 18062]|uniref:type II toxin-antitoxin system HipA family toxin n=1 Tax=Microbacterium sp. 18062 TaxID=2681410 RepID=UPI00135962CF|nr:HipA domain-containing protein [Microbacterium sp. 18062]